MEASDRLTAPAGAGTARLRDDALPSSAGRESMSSCVARNSSAWMFLPSRIGLRDENTATDPGAQTERWGGSGPVRRQDRAGGSFVKASEIRPTCRSADDTVRADFHHAKVVE